MFPGRCFKTLLPNCSSAPVRNEEVAEFNCRVMAKAKAYADGKRKVLASSLSVGDTVLIRQQKRNKLTSFFGPKPYKIVAIKGSMISARLGVHIVVRNSSFFKRVRLPSEEPKQPVVAPKSLPRCRGARQRDPRAVQMFQPDPAATGLESVRPNGNSTSGSGRPVTTGLESVRAGNDSASCNRRPATTGLESVRANGEFASNRNMPLPGAPSEEATLSDRHADVQPAILVGNARLDSDATGDVALQSSGDEGVAPVEEDSGDDDFIDAEEAPNDFVDNAAAPRVAAYHPPSGVPIQDSNFSLPSNIRHNHDLRPRPGGRTD